MFNIWTCSTFGLVQLWTCSTFGKMTSQKRCHRLKTESMHDILSAKRRSMLNIYVHLFKIINQSQKIRLLPYSLIKNKTFCLMYLLINNLSFYSSKLQIFGHFPRSKEMSYTIWTSVINRRLALYLIQILLNFSESSNWWNSEKLYVSLNLDRMLLMLMIGNMTSPTPYFT